MATVSPSTPAVNNLGILGRLTELTARPQWVCWRLEPNLTDPAKPRKVPYTPRGDTRASSTNFVTWGTFTEASDALKHHPDTYAGLGFVFDKGGGLFGLDLDNVRDPISGDIEPWALAWVKRLNTYTEVSQSGKGLHCIGRGVVPPGGNKRGQVEMYDQGRFFVMTGNPLEGYPLAITDCGDVIAELHRQHFTKPNRPATNTRPTDGAGLGMADDEVLRRAREAANGAKFERLWAGNTGGDHSAADLALCNLLAFWTGNDVAQIDRLFRASGLYRPKWDERHYSGGATYGQHTIEQAISDRSEVYTGRGNGGAAAPAGHSPTPMADTSGGELQDDDGDEFAYALSDLGNGKRFAALHRERARFVAQWGWLLWDGRRWVRDDAGGAMRLAVQVVRQLYREAAAAATEDRRKAIADHARRSESVRARKAMLESAAAELAMVARPEDFDADPWVLNCANGVLDLRTRELHPHDPSYLCTRLAPADYIPGATHLTWTAYLHDSTAGDRELEAYLQRAAGYLLTGSTAEEVFFFLLGPAATGKTTLVEALQAILGNYAVTASFDTFLEGRDVGTARPDLARLAGARMVSACEASATRKLAEQVVKRLVGGDTMTARYLFHDEFSFRPICKLLLAANDSPKISDTDSAVWRRLRRIPFERIVPEDKRDPAVKATLTTDPGAMSAVLAWAVEGCRLWQRDGLGYPQSVKAKTAELRASFDPLADFLAECCRFDAGAWVRAKDLRDAYMRWTADMKARPVGNKEWGDRLEAHGCARDTRRLGTPPKPAKVWAGVELSADGGDSPTSVGSVTDVTNAGGSSEKSLHEPVHGKSSGNTLAIGNISNADDDGEVL